MVTFAVTDVSEVVPMSGALVETVDNVGDKHQGFLETLEAHPHLGAGALIEEVTEVLCL